MGISDKEYHKICKLMSGFVKYKAPYFRGHFTYELEDMIADYAAWLLTKTDAYRLLDRELGLLEAEKQNLEENFGLDSSLNMLSRMNELDAMIADQRFKMLTLEPGENQ